MGERLSLEQCVRELADACLRDRSFFEAVVKVLMCTVDLEDRLAKRKRTPTSVKTCLAIPAPSSYDAPEDGFQQKPPLFIAFETVEGSAVYIADRGSSVVAEAREKGVAEIPAEVYMPPYRLPSGLKLKLERAEPGWVTIVGGTPPQVTVPVKSEDHLRIIASLLKLRGIKPEIRQAGAIDYGGHTDFIQA